MANWEPYNKAKAPRHRCAAHNRAAAGIDQPGGTTQGRGCAECGRMFSIQDMIGNKGSYICAVMQAGLHAKTE